MTFYLKVLLYLYLINQIKKSNTTPLVSPINKDMVMEIYFGSMKIPIKVLVDTGSEMLVLPCYDDNPSGLDLTGSKTLKILDTEKSIHYVDGTVSGFLATDYIYINTTEILIEFLCFNKQDHFYEYTYQWDGIMGLNMKYIENMDESIIASLHNIKKQTQFGITICQKNNDQFIVDNLRPKGIKVNLINSDYFSVQMTSIKINDHDIQLECENQDRETAYL
ncbi:hypothetical protein A3Q56_07569 [Intoshia linei]|uniref:Peptidase A1 domain-containing protein n=1 Tax=Intoshia linei TaxID=1819745 RepID=A0A177ART1_9BILA|nr:hypothetical protein A3Q56_07569 [Intoshia linei]